jgi:hypothetical protein
MLQTGSGDTTVAIYDIDSLRIPTKSNWRWIGLGVGASLDITAIIIWSVYQSMDINLGGLNRER